MRVRVTFDLDDEMRRAISYRYGREKPATRAEIESNIEALVNETWQDYLYEYENGRARPREEDEE